MTASLVDRQRRLFLVLEEFFERVTGDTIASFGARGTFDSVVRNRATAIASRGESAFSWLESTIRPFYSETWRAVFSDARQLGGMKLVLGGTSRFQLPQLESVRKMSLYTDTILVPDPIIPWLEIGRHEERFRHVLLLEQVFWLLHLKPLIDADLPYPAVLVFPSWEKGLEATDATTQKRQFALTAAVVGHHTGRPVADMDELRAFSLDQPVTFLEGVERARLLLSPGASASEPIAAGLARYLEQVGAWRSEDHMAVLRGMPDSLLALYAITERLAPQYHLLENAEELCAQPMLCSPAHWHYYQLIASTFEGALLDRGALTSNTVAVLKSLNHPEASWLGNVPMAALVELRRNNENEGFRKALAEHTSQLHEAELSDLDRVAAQVGRGIASLIAEHQRDVRRIDEDYRISHSRTLAGGLITAAALFVPALAPFVGGLASPIALAGAYAHTKHHEALDRRRAARSLTGVLAYAKSATP